MDLQPSRLLFVLSLSLLTVVMALAIAQSDAASSVAYAFDEPGNENMATVNATESVIPNSTKPIDFQLVSIGQGWILLESRLYWTKSNGVDWVDITPPAVESISSAYFVDRQQGWILLGGAGLLDASDLEVGMTVDGGQTWEIERHSLVEPGSPASMVSNAHLQFIDAKTGWLSMRQATGSNFSVGNLFRTDDGGRSWRQQSLPIGERTYFVSSDFGWTAGGARGDELYQTTDGGDSWQEAGQRILQLPNWQQHWYESSIFIDSGEGVFEITSAPATADGSTSTSNPSSIGMISQDDGWATRVVENCHINESDRPTPCSNATELIVTKDGGQTWEIVQIPRSTRLTSDPVSLDKLAPTLTETNPVGGASNTRTITLQGQGFDKCEVPSIDELGAWSSGSPYDVLNLYIGGSSRYCPNSSLSSSFLAKVADQGWSFLPTWVGPQAPCSEYLSKISSDLNIAYSQGVNEARSALQATNSLDLSDGGSGTIIYYDLEAYPDDRACRDATKSFMSGWSAELHRQGSLSGVYGSPCGSFLGDFAGLSNVPDALWPAHWIYSNYQSNVTVWGLSCLSDAVFNRHQRIFQYTGGHLESYGGVGLTIDSNVIDGIVALHSGSDNDTVPGEATIEWPAENATLAGAFEISGWATDAGSGIDRVETWIDGSFVGNAEYGIYHSDLDTDVGYRWRDNTALYAPGGHTLQMQFYDNAGNMSERTRTVVFDDVVPPNLPSHLSPADNAWVKSSSVAFSWQDNGDPDNEPWSNLAFSVSISTKTDCTDPVNGVGGKWSEADYFLTTWNASLADGTYYWCLYAFDGEAGSGWSNARKLSVETAHNADWLSHNTPTSMVSSATYTFALSVKNTGSLTWPNSGSNQVNLAYHWLDSAGQIVQWDGVRTLLPTPVAPADSINLNATVIAPSQPGTYILQWDMVHEEVTWFSQKGASTERVIVHVAENVAENAPPNLPLLYSPSDGALSTSRTITLEWEDTGDPDNAPSPTRYFSVEVANDPGFAQLVAGVGDRWETGTEYRGTSWTTTLPSDGEYYWRVYAHDGLEASGWTGYRQFTIVHPLYIPVVQQ